MIQKTFKYTDFNGDVREDTFYFHLSKADIVELELSEEGGAQKMIEKIVAEQNNRKVLQYFKEILAMSVGQKSEDGRRFIRNEEIKNDFIQSPAYDELLFELMDSGDGAAKFVNGLFPADLAKAVENQNKGVRTPSDRKPKASSKASTKTAKA